MIFDLTIIGIFKSHYYLLLQEIIWENLSFHLTLL